MIHEILKVKKLSRWAILFTPVEQLGQKFCRKTT